MTLAVARFSRRAQADLSSIDQYTVATWGLTQADCYLNAIQEYCEWLAGNPALGRECHDLRPGLRRIEHGEHVIFYRIHPEGILVSRVLHRSMHPARHSMEDKP